MKLLLSISKLYIERETQVFLLIDENYKNEVNTIIELMNKVQK
jgi:hypothetical protein